MSRRDQARRANERVVMSQYGSFQEYIRGEIGDRDDKWMKGLNKTYSRKEFIDKFKGELPVLNQYVGNPNSMPYDLYDFFSRRGHLIDAASKNNPQLKQNLATLLATDQSDPNFNEDTYNQALFKAGQEIADSVKDIHKYAFNFYNYNGLPTIGVDIEGRSLAGSLEYFYEPYLRSQDIDYKAIESYSLNYISPSFTAQANAEQYFRDNPLAGTPAQNRQNFEALNNELLGQLDSNDPYASAVINKTDYSTTERGGFINIRDTVTGGLSDISPISTDLVSDIIRGTGVIASFTPLGPAALAITNVADQAFNSILTEGDFSQVDPVALAGAVVSTAAAVVNIDAEQAARDAAENGGTPEQIDQARQAVLDTQGNTEIFTNVLNDNFDLISKISSGDPFDVAQDLKFLYDDYTDRGGDLDFLEFTGDLFEGDSSFDFSPITEPFQEGLEYVGDLASGTLDSIKGLLPDDINTPEFLKNLEDTILGIDLDTPEALTALVEGVKGLLPEGINVDTPEFLKNLEDTFKNLVPDIRSLPDLPDIGSLPDLPSTPDGNLDGITELVSNLLQEREQAVPTANVSFSPIEDIQLQEYDLNSDEDVLSQALQSINAIRV